MGKIASKACTDCLAFLNLKRTTPLQYLELAEYGAVKGPVEEIIEEKKTNDDSSVASTVDESEFLNIYSRPLEEDCEKMSDKDGFVVYAQDLEEGFLIKAQWKSKFTPQEILYYFRLTSQRKSWDKNVDFIEEIPGENSEEYMTYMKFKKMIAISQRDMMIISNISEKSNGVMVTSKSCHHENYPEKEGITRMQIFLAGYYFERIHEDEYKTKIFSLTKAHFGGSISQKFIKKATTMTLPKLYQTMEKCMHDYYKLNS